MGVTTANELTRDALPDAPEGEWLDTQLEFQNGVNRQVIAAITQALPFGGSELANRKYVDLVHGVAASVTSPLGQGVPVQQIIPFSCVGVTVDSTGNPTRANYNLAVPQIEWHPLNKVDATGNPQFTVTAIYNNQTSTAGQLGELSGPISRVRSNALAMTSGVAANLATPTTSIALTSGDWMIGAMAGTNTGATTSWTNLQLGIATTSATMPGLDTIGVPTNGQCRYELDWPGTVPGAGANISLVIPPYPVTIAANTTTNFFLVGLAAFTISTLSMFGSMVATRRLPYLTTTRGKVGLLFVGGA